MSPRRTRLTVMTLLVGAVSLVLFAYSLRAVGLSEIGDALGRLGPAGFGLVLALSGFRLVARSLAWIACVEGTRRLGVREAVTATLMGEALGNVTPLGTLVAEPSKAVFVRDRVTLPAALSGIVIENIFYTSSVALMIGVGAVAFLLQFPMPQALRLASLAAIAAVVAVVGGAWWVLAAGAKPVSGVIGWLNGRGLGGRRLHSQLDRVRRFEEQINTFSRRARGRLGRVAMWEAVFHVAGVAEVWVTLAFIAPDSVTLLKALVLEAVGRVINVLFRFVPMRFGVDEAGNLLLARPLALPQASLVALPLVRKARLIAWTGVGVLLLLQRGLSVRKAITETENLELRSKN